MSHTESATIIRLLLSFCITLIVHILMVGSYALLFELCTVVQLYLVLKNRDTPPTEDGMAFASLRVKNS